MLLKKICFALLALYLSGVLLMAATTAVRPSAPCPQNCSYTYNVNYKPTIPATVVINWYKTAGGAIDHTQTFQSPNGFFSFEVPGNGTWYVQLTLTANDHSLAPTMATYQIAYPSTLIPLTPPPKPGAPKGFQIVRNVRIETKITDLSKEIA